MTRASYQDSNIFVTDRATNETVQKTAGSEVKDVHVRNTNTFKSGVFAGAKDYDMRQRNQNTFNSTAFAGAKPNECKRVKLEPQGAGTEKLFGSDQTKYDKSSENPMIPKQDRAKKTQDQINAKEKVRREYYDQASQKYGTCQDTKRDGALIAQNVDWKNANERAIERKDT